MAYPPDSDNNLPKRLTLKDLSEDDRPREKMQRLGVASLTNVELLAILLRSGSTDCTVIEVAQQMLNMANNNLNDLGQLSLHQLTRLKGVGPTKAITVMAALELGRRRGTMAGTERPTISSSSDVVRIMQPLLADLPHEEFWALFLNRSNRVIDKLRISQGGISGTVVDVRMIIQPAIERLAASIVLVHNHPSGNCKPSPNDKALTQQIGQAAKLFTIKLIDHIIITNGRYFSFTDEGMMEV
ncbi:MAG: DNA repair protein RadC [Bacteroidales bacterium]|nr:DNA repair protein RadC [Bacteroidales bacterium]